MHFLIKLKPRMFFERNLRLLLYPNILSFKIQIWGVESAFSTCPVYICLIMRQWLSLSTFWDHFHSRTSYSYFPLDCDSPGNQNGMASQESEVQRPVLDNDSMIEGISDQVLLAVVLSITFLVALTYMLLR